MTIKIIILVDSSLSMHSHNVKDSQLYFEYSFLGNHPEHCFQRTKITQSILNSEFHFYTLSCVVWINRDNSTELCICGNSSEISKEDLQSILDAIAYQFYDYSAIWVGIVVFYDLLYDYLFCFNINYTTICFMNEIWNKEE